jgi:O-antigen ligase/Tfp pilus assembly protein PilF
MNANRNHALSEALARPIAGRRQLARGCDFALTGAVMMLVIWAPLARGAEGPGAVATAEQLVFALIIIWALKAALLPPRVGPGRTGLIALAAPMAALCLYLALQLVALSPAVLKIVSGSTHALYVQTLGSRLPPADYRAAGSSTAGLLPERWETISIAPALTRAALLKLLAYCALLLVIAGYPLEPAADGRQERGFAGALTLAVLASAVMAGLAGALSLFATHRVSAGAVALATARAKGTFHNPDHFADYLMLTIPLAVVGVLSPQSFVRRQWREPFAVFAAVAAVAGLVGLLISLSRGAWLATLVALAALVLAVTRRACADQSAANAGQNHARQEIARQKIGRQKIMTRRAAAAASLLLLLALIVSGAPATERIGARLHETTNHDDSVTDRFAVWRDSLAIVRDFPLLGVGLGGWPEIFTRYNRSPWDAESFWRETHNDYLQLMEESGAIGFMLFLWVLLSQARALARARRIASPRQLMTVAAAGAAAAGFAAHELFDFNFQVPANALLLMVIVGLAHRQAAAGGVQWWQPARIGVRRIWGPAAGAGSAVLALLLIAYAARHDRLSYPYNLDAQMDAAQSLNTRQAAARIAMLMRAYPAHAALHLELAQYLLKQNETAAARGELETAFWLEPANPQAHDSLAQVLFEQSDSAGCRREITASVRYSPRPSTHDYLNPSAIPRLTAAELKAVEDGYQQALWNPDAVYGLAYLYNRLGRFRERGTLYAGAARLETDPATRLDYLLKGGQSYALAGDPAGAGAVLRQAAALDPTSPRPYRILAALYLSHHGLARARAAIRAGIAAGADAVALNLALAEAAAKAGDKGQTLEALNQAMESGPVGFDDNLQIGVMYLDCADFERAIRPLKAAAAADPRSPDGYYYLALAEQNSYNFAAAASAFKSALELAPERADIQTAFASLQHEIDINGGSEGRHNTALHWDPKTMTAPQGALKPFAE